MYNILYISYDGLTDPLGQSQILPYLLGLSKHNYHFKLVSLEKPDNFLANKAAIDELIKNSTILWIPVTYSTKKGISSKFKNNKSLENKCTEIINSTKINLIHSRSYPASIIGMNAAKKTKIPFIFDMRGFWADERVDGKIWNLKKPHQKLLYNYFKRKEKQLLKNSTHIVSLTQAAKNYLVKNFSLLVNENKITVIPCCADLNLFNLSNLEQNKKDIRNKLSIQHNQQVLIYLGSIGTWYLLSEMIDFFKTYLMKLPNAVFLLITQNDHEIAKDLFQKKEIPLKNYRIQSAQRNEVASYIHASNNAIYFIKPAFSKMASSPVKLAEFMGCGLPVIANSGIGDVDLQAQQNNQLILINELTETGYIDGINKLKELKTNAEQTRRFAIENYSLEMGVERYKNVYDTILKNSEPT